MAVQFHPCTTFSIVGATNTGKSFFVYRLLKNKAEMFTEEPEKVLYCYSIFHDLLGRMEREIPQFQLHQGLPSKQELDDFCGEGKKHRLIVLDDLMTDITASKEMCKLVTEGCHHRHCSTITISHNIHERGRCAKTISLNTHVLVLFKSMRSVGQIDYLGRQIFPHAPHAISESYQDCVKRKYGYLVIDLSPHTSNEEYRLRTNVMPDEWPVIIYSVRD